MLDAHFAHKFQVSLHSDRGPAAILPCRKVLTFCIYFTRSKIHLTNYFCNWLLAKKTRLHQQLLQFRPDSAMASFF